MKVREHPMFVDAPPERGSAGRRRSSLLPLLEELTRHPGRWAKLAECDPRSSKSVVTKINQGAFNALPPGFSFEAVIRGGALYARAFPRDEGRERDDDAECEDDLTLQRRRREAP